MCFLLTKPARVLPLIILSSEDMSSHVRLHSVLEFEEEDSQLRFDEASRRLVLVLLKHREFVGLRLRAASGVDAAQMGVLLHLGFDHEEEESATYNFAPRNFLSSRSNQFVVHIQWNCSSLL